MKKTTLDTSLLPKMWIDWETTKGRFWLECSTGKKYAEKPNIVFSWRNKEDVLHRANSYPAYAYLKYHKDIDMLEIAAATIDTSRKEVARSWKYADNKYFINKSKQIFDENGKEIENTERFDLYANHWAYGFSNLLRLLYRLSYNPEIIDEFKSFLGDSIYTTGNGKSIEVKYLWHLQDWYVKKQKGKSNGKAQRLTDKLTAIKLSDISDIGTKYPIKKFKDKYGHERLADYIMLFERVNDEWSVLRMIRRTVDNKVYETERMYLSDNGANRIVSFDNNTSWTPSRQTYDYGCYNFVNKEEAIQKCDRLKYIVPLFNENEERIKGVLMKALQFPEIEQLMKLGYKDIAMKIAKSNTAKADMKNMFGGYYNEKETALLRKAGLNKHQFDKCLANENNWYSNGAMKEMREFFGDDMVHLDDKTFDKYYNVFHDIVSRASWNGGIKRYSERLNLDYKKLVKNIVRLADKSTYTCIPQVLNDTMQMYLNLNRGTAPEIDWYFDCYSDLARVHEAINALKHEQDAERRAMWSMEETERRKKEEERRKKLDEERKKLEYEDDNYIIRLPLDGNEIVNEGTKQRICIGGYVSSHSTGSTNLFFIRKKDTPSMPFYAIQMNNNKEIVQIHGYCNRWLGNNPEVIPTVIRWLRKNGIKCDDKILTCTSTGYGSVNNYVQMPVVD